MATLLFSSDGHSSCVNCRTDHKKVPTSIAHICLASFPGARGGEKKKGGKGGEGGGGGGGGGGGERSVVRERVKPEGRVRDTGV